MNRYIALLRGINISGRNKIPMAELKSYFIELGFIDVSTVLNSGNIIFSSEERNEMVLADKIRNMIQERFELDIPVFIIAQIELKYLLDKAPAWWGSEGKEIYDNLIFVLPSTTAEILADKIGEPTKEIEQTCLVENSIFWSFDRQKYAKGNWWKKTASTGISELITIRTANTVRKIVEM